MSLPIPIPVLPFASSRLRVNPGLMHQTDCQCGRGQTISLTPAALKTLRRKEAKKVVAQLYQSQSRFVPLRLRVFA